MRFVDSDTNTEVGERRRVWRTSAFELAAGPAILCACNTQLVTKYIYFITHYVDLYLCRCYRPVPAERASVFFPPCLITATKQRIVGRPRRL